MFWAVRGNLQFNQPIIMSSTAIPKTDTEDQAGVEVSKHTQHTHTLTHTHTLSHSLSLSATENVFIGS